MKELILKIMGCKECEHCHKMFSKYGGDWIMQVYPTHTEIKMEKRWYCKDHRPNFCLSLGIYNSYLKNTGNLKFIINAQRTGFKQIDS